MDAVTLEMLQTPSAYHASVSGGVAGSTGNIRLDAVRDAAMGLGIRGGIKARTDELVAAMEANKRSLDKIYDFTPYLIAGRVLPPVVVESQDIYTQGSDTDLRMAGRSYKIESQARFVSRPPTWREYVVQRYDVSMPAAALLPKNSEEQNLWSRVVAEGWNQGREQADMIFNANFDRLNRDFIGIVRFHKLVESNVVTMPFIASSSMAITGDDQSIALDEKLLRITVLPRFNMNILNWKARPGKVVVNEQQIEVSQ